jgi:2-phosphosulfolactate phosphatase
MPAKRSLDVFLLPNLVESDELAGKTVVVVDVLRATTTIIHALSAGATEVIPSLEVEEATRLAATRPGTALLGGERSGRKIPGFDLGNSPTEYTPDVVGGKSVIFTTTNGTRALNRCRKAQRVLIGAFVNISAICRELTDVEQIAIVCAGTDGHVTREDTLFAGAVVHELVGQDSSCRVQQTTAGQVLPYMLNDQAEIAADAWRASTHDLTGFNPLGAALRASRGGRNLIEIGAENDIDLAAEIDKFDRVPQLDLAAWRIT